MGASDPRRLSRLPGAYGTPKPSSLPRGRYWIHPKPPLQQIPVPQSACHGVFLAWTLVSQAFCLPSSGCCIRSRLRPPPMPEARAMRAAFQRRLGDGGLGRSRPGEGPGQPGRRGSNIFPRSHNRTGLLNGNLTPSSGYPNRLVPLGVGKDLVPWSLVTLDWTLHFEQPDVGLRVRAVPETHPPSCNTGLRHVNDQPALCSPSEAKRRSASHISKQLAGLTKATPPCSWEVPSPPETQPDEALSGW